MKNGNEYSKQVFSVNEEAAQTTTGSHRDEEGSQKSCCDEEKVNRGKRTGFISRFLGRLAKANARSFGGSPPKCH